MDIINYNNNAINTFVKYVDNLKSSNLLEDEDLLKFNSLLSELRENFENQTIWRNEILMRYSVLNDKDCPDNASKYFQAKTEQLVFFEELILLSLRFKKTIQELELKEVEIEELYDKLYERLKKYEERKIKAQINIKEIEKQEIIFSLERMKVEARERMREIALWSKLKKEYDDGTFNTINQEESQLISLTRRYIQEAWNVFNLGGPYTDISSVNNILGQFETLCRTCIEKGIMNKVLSIFNSNSDMVKFVKSTFKMEEKHD